MIQLNDKLLVGAGMMRSCYRHPEEAGKCVKIFHKKFRQRTHEKEVRELARLRKRKSKHSLIVPRYYGEAETNLGTGYVFDLVTADGKDCPTFRTWLQSHPEKAEAAREQLSRDLLQSAVVFADLNCGNVLVVEEEGTIRFAVVDGLGEGTLIKVCSRVPFFARRKLKRKWSVIENEVKEILAHPSS
jgi:hypothetical protein